MLKNNLVLLLLLIFSPKLLRGDDTISAELKAENFIKEKILKDSKAKLNSFSQKTFLKNAMIVRVQKSVLDKTVWTVAIGYNQKPFILPLKEDLTIFLHELNPLLKEEKTDLKTPKEASAYLLHVLNIYGIYEAKLDCEKGPREKSFACKANQTKPREFMGSILVSSDGMITDIN